jgi:hypothetical protein
MTPARHIALMTALPLALLPPAAGAQDRSKGDWREGRDYAEENCSRCHVVGDFNPYGGIGSTPSFQLLARRDDWMERFLTFYVRRPHPVVVRIEELDTGYRGEDFVEPFEFELTQMDDLIAFIEWLEAQEEAKQ